MSKLIPRVFSFFLPSTAKKAKRTQFVTVRAECNKGDDVYYPVNRSRSHLCARETLKGIETRPRGKNNTLRIIRNHFSTLNRRDIHGKRLRRNFFSIKATEATMTYIGR